jgi:hypothetical protein
MKITMKILPFFVLFIFQTFQVYCQTISGKVCASNNVPLIYASIGIIETSFGTITNEEGCFNLEAKGLSIKSLVRFSMIGYKSHTYTIEELLNKKVLIQLESESVKLPEVIVKPSGKSKKIGTTGYSFRGGICGWGGDQFGKGWELGTKIELGDSPVKIKSLHIRINHQSFDSTLFRLHIRDIVDNLPLNELLNNNILISLSKDSGWSEIDLSKYNLVFKGDIALSLEWIKVIGASNVILIKTDGQERLIPAVTFNIKLNRESIFTKWGTEAKWVRHYSGSPSIYLTITD